ncbi:MAG: C4-dicarboxylate transporter DcuC [Candidatus Methylacidiphilales bacterium]
MQYFGLILSLFVIIIVARLLIKNFFAQAVLLIAGVIMLFAKGIIDFFNPMAVKKESFLVVDTFEFIKESLSNTNANVGLMIMVIGGFVAYIDKIGASEALVKIALKPLSFLKKHPHLAAVCVVPIGQILFICVPSAAGLGLLLMASVFPILISLGVSRLAAVSIITSTTAFCIGPASVITASATQIAKIDTVPYFVDMQLPIAIILNFVLMISYFFVNKYYDKKDQLMPINNLKKEKESNSAPAIYAIIPILPLVILLLFSGVFTIFPVKLKIETTTAMLISLFVAIIFELIKTRDIKNLFSSFKIFFDGMGDIFKTVVTLIIAAEVFANGLISIGFIDGLISISQSLGFGAIGLGIIMTIMIFLAAILMGSGNAAFFAFGPLIPNAAAKFGVASTSILLPMNLSASMGRALSPLAGILLATAEIAGVSSMDIVKRNFIPIAVSLITLLIYHFGLCF